MSLVPPPPHYKKTVPLGDELEKIPKPPQHIIKVTDCPITSVTVYPSQAMIVRQAKVTFTQVGEQQVVIDSMSSSSVNDSVRVTGLGHCTIVEVVYKNEKVKKQKKKDVETQVAALEESKKKFTTSIQELIEKEEALQKARARVDKERNFLGNYSEVILKVSKDDRHIADLLKAQTLNSISDYMNFNTKEEERIQGVFNEIDKEKSALADQRSKLQAEVRKIDDEISKIRNNIEWRNRAVVTVDVSKADTDAEFTLQYIVSNSSWKASYDARIESGATPSQKSTFKLMYYGIIQQNTGEAWNDCNISLSTADTKRRAIEPPTLNKQYVNYSYSNSYRTKSYSVSQQSQQDDLDEDYSDDENDEDNNDGEDSQKEMGVQQTQAESGTTSSIFHIPRAATIPSDDAPHKVTVAVINLDCNLSHYAVPKMDTNAYIKVKTRNESEYQLLPGPMNVFIDGSFVARGKMQNVNVGESFKNFLGVDPSIKIEYKAPLRVSEVSGVFSKYRKVNVTRHFTVKNTKPAPVEIVLKDQVPKSQDNDIKVDLIFPVFPKDKNTVANLVSLVEKPAQNAPKAPENKLDWKKEENHIQWTLKLPASSAEVALELKYTVGWNDSANLDQESL